MMFFKLVGYILMCKIEILFNFYIKNINEYSICTTKILSQYDGKKGHIPKLGNFLLI